MVKDNKRGSIFTKTIFKLIYEKKIRFALNLFIVMVSISLTAGIGALTNSYEPGYISNYEKSLTPDVILKYVPSEGDNTLWTEDRINKVNNIEGVEKITQLVSIDQHDEEHENYRLLIYKDIKEEAGLGLPTLIEGEYPSNAMHNEEIEGVNSRVFESLILQGIKGERNHQIGELVKLTFPFGSMNVTMYTKVTGYASNPLYTSKQQERGMSEDDEYYLNNIYFTDLSMFGSFSGMLKITDLYVYLNCNHKYLTSDYENEVKAYVNKIEEEFGDNVKCLSLEENTSYALFREYNKKINRISIIFPFFFVSVCALVVVVIMSRLIADERSAIACNFSIGVPTRRIYTKYIFYSVLSSFIGALGGYILGCYILPRIIFTTYNSVFAISYSSFTLLSPVGFITGGLVIIATFLVTYFSLRKCLKETPAELLKAKAPKPGKKILLEKIPMIWNRISFSFKNSIRNIFRHKKNLILTSLSVVGSTILIFLGLGLKDCSDAVKNDPLFENVGESIGFISAVIVLYGAVISSLIIYALSSMNIDEREREIAVLKVLGYKDIECALFIFRELILITVFAGLLGIPVSMGCAQAGFSFLNFGDLSNITWHTYLITYAIIVTSGLVSSFILYRKIKKIDFNVSLKSLE